jgi:hypothetical protein
MHLSLLWIRLFVRLPPGYRHRSQFAILEHFPKIGCHLNNFDFSFPFHFRLISQHRQPALPSPAPELDCLAHEPPIFISEKELHLKANCQSAPPF